MEGVGGCIKGVKQLKKKKGAKQAERFTPPGGGGGQGFFSLFNLIS